MGTHPLYKLSEILLPRHSTTQTMCSLLFVHLQDVNVLTLPCTQPLVAGMPHTHLLRSRFVLPTRSCSPVCLATSSASSNSRQHSTATSRHVELRDPMSSHCPYSALATPRERSLELRNQLSYNPRGPFLAIVYSAHVAFTCRFATFG